MGKNIESIMMNVPSLCSSLELLELFGTIESVSLAIWRDTLTSFVQTNKLFYYLPFKARHLRHIYV